MLNITNHVQSHICIVVGGYRLPNGKYSVQVLNCLQYIYRFEAKAD